MSADIPSPSPAPHKVRRAPRWVWITMIASLALNLLIIGGAIGAAWHFRYTHALRGSGPAHFGKYIMTLPAERRDQIDQILQAERRLLGPLRREAHRARRAVRRAFVSETFDAARFRELNQRAIESRTKVLRARQELFPKIAEKLTLEERRKFVEWRAKHRSRRWRRRRHQAPPPSDGVQ